MSDKAAAIFDSQRLLLIAGPCSLENEDVSFAVAEKLADLRSRYPELNLVFKGSFDKANRTSLSSPRGPGLKDGLRILADVKARYQMPVLTDIHESQQAEAVGEVCDILQIPAFLC
ncbi:MAG: 3-deoxy-8-phosphooctulonate synthase, partial [Opitutales bacterium]|nr:3-deoxy-8-phosphooctulonate synthase [Opitutales bacterium]